MAGPPIKNPSPPPPQLLDEDFGELGPKMQALRPQHRLFCWYFAHNGGDATAAYRLAYPNATTEMTIRVNGSKLRARADIRDALAEMAKYQFHALTIPSIQALANVLNNPSHKQYAKVATYVLDRSGFMPEQMIKHEHVHKLDASQVDEKLLAIATLLGQNVADKVVPKPALPAPIDAEFEEIPNQEPIDEDW